MSETRSETQAADAAANVKTDVSVDAAGNATADTMANALTSDGIAVKDMYNIVVRTYIYHKKPPQSIEEVEIKNISEVLERIGILKDCIEKSLLLEECNDRRLIINMTSKSDDNSYPYVIILMSDWVQKSTEIINWKMSIYINNDVHFHPKETEFYEIMIYLSDKFYSVFKDYKNNKLEYEDVLMFIDIVNTVFGLNQHVAKSANKV